MGKIKRITEEQIEQIIEMYLSNYSKIDIAKQFDISTQSVTKYLLKNNIKQKEHYLSKDIKQVVCELYTHKNIPLTKIAKELNIDFQSVKRALSENNVQLRDKSKSCQKYNLDENYFDIINTQNKAYILGFLYADGNVGKNNYAIQLCLQEDDRHILEEIKTELNSNIPLYYKNRTAANCKNTYTLTINNKHMHQSLIEKGVVPQKTFVLKFPEFLDEELVRHFIRGYFDGDGCFGYYKRKDRKNGYSPKFNIVGTTDFCQKIKEIIECKLDVHCSIGYCHQKYDSPIRDLSISGAKNCLKVLSWIYNDAEMFLTRKKNKYLEFYNLYNSTY